MGAQVKFTDTSTSAKNGMMEQEKKALRATAKLLRKVVKDATPVQRGWLKKSIGTWVKTNRRDGSCELQIGVYTSDRAKKKHIEMPYANRYAHLVEFGTSHSPAHSFLKEPTRQNIEAIRRAQAEYLPGLVNLDEFEDIDEEVE